MAGHTSNADETREFVHRLSKVIAGVLDEEDFRHAEYIGRETDMKTWGESCQLLETQNKLRRDRFLIHEFRENLTNFFAGQLLDKFIEKNFPSANWDDKEFLKQEIKEGIEGCSRYARESIEPRNPLELAENYIQRIVKEGLTWSAQAPAREPLLAAFISPWVDCGQKHCCPSDCSGDSRRRHNEV